MLNVSGNPLIAYDLYGLYGSFHPIEPKGEKLPACIQRIRQKALALFNFADDQLIHCYVSCKLISECGLGSGGAALLGYLKELKDVVGPGDAEARDLFNNAAGRSCAISGEPECAGCNNQISAKPGECKLCCQCKADKGELRPRGS